MKGSGVISTGQAYTLLEVARMTPSQEEYRTIPLTQGQVAIVDAADFDWLNQYKWQASWERDMGKFYAVRNTSRRDGPKTRVGMHRLILGLKYRDGVIVDHKNRDTLDNRRSNLRIATASQNIANQKKPRHNKSGFKGVYWRCGKWRAQIKKDRRRFDLGGFDSAVEAHNAYIKAATELHGEFARFA
jgi:hypothetical protein